MSDFVEVKIRIPLYTYNGVDFVNIRDKYLRLAGRSNKLLKIISPHGTHYTTPQEWKKTGKKVEQIFRFKDRPMKMVGNYCTPNEPNMDEYIESRCRLRDIALKLGILK